MNPGDILDGRYEILAHLGAGGMGEVYKAKHSLLGSPRVIKIVHPHISSNIDARDRFLREARAATKVQHSNVATLHDFATLPSGAHYMVWEFIDGENLAQRLRTRGTLPPRQAVRIAIQALRGLEAIHRAGIVHRDISPENLMITTDDEVKIIDLGVAKIEDPDAVAQTRTGIFVGKLRYAAPEQLGFLNEDEKIDARADLYALAMVVVELLTGRPPYEAKSPHEYFLHHAREVAVTVVTLPNELPGSTALQSVLEKALSRDRAQRFPTARDFANALEDIERTLPTAQQTPTMAIPFDGDATLKVTPSPEARTEPMDAPAPPAPATILTPLPATPQPPPPVVAAAALPVAKRRSGLNPILLVAFFAVILMAVGAFALWPKVSSIISPARKPETPTQTVAQTQTAAPQRAVSSVEVTPTLTTTTSESPTPVLTASVPVTQTVPQVQQSRPPAHSPIRRPDDSTITREPANEPEPEPEPAPARRRFVPVYIDGPGHSSGNERALDRLYEEMRGVNEVALRAGGMQIAVYNAIKRNIPHLTFEPEASVVIRFDGTPERLRRQGRHLAAAATIEKNGEVVFRYEIPISVARGAAPEAFAQTIAEAFSQ